MTEWIVQTETRPAPSGPSYEGLVGPCEIVTNPAYRHGGGYAQTLRRGGRRGTPNPQAHRWLWELHRGPIPDGLHVLHACDVRSCVALDHLRLGTAADNARDRDERGRAASQRGEANGNARLTAADVIVIRERYAAGGISIRALAREYGVDRSTIQKIIHRRTWKHV